MSSVLSKQARLPWLIRIQRSLLGWRVSFGSWIRRAEEDEYRFIAQVADELADHMEIWVVEASVEILAHIACWHRQVETYRGHLLCSDTSGQTFLMDLQSWGFVKSATARFLQIDGVDQAKRFIDTLWKHRSKEGDEYAKTR